jgi:glycosyltransferase involved in cell wall biosynthesis
MNRPRIVFCYRYGLLGGVSAQFLNRFPYLSQHCDISIVYEQDRGMVGRFPSGVASVAASHEDRIAAIRHAAPDITVVVDSPNFVEAWRQARSPGRLVVEVHTTTSNVTYLQRRELLSEVARFVTVSSYMERLLRRHDLHELADIAVVPNCLDERWRRAHEPVAMDGTPAVWVGKLDAHKRWRTATDLLDQLADNDDLNVIPVLVGGLTAPASEVAALSTKLATSTGLSRAVWWPWVEYDRMPRLYATVGHHGGVHLSTTVNESFGMSVAESLMQGCPVIAPAVGALPELLPPAALYQPGDWADAGRKARRALIDPAYRAELLSTVDRVGELTAPQTMVSAYLEVVAGVLGETPVPVATREARR